MNENDLIQQAYEEVEKHQELAESDPYRLDFHLMPPAGLLNDPNGLIYYKGAYHVFYQWNPFETAHGAKFWGHFTSTDLVGWQEEKIALAPSEWYERNGCYSGSAVEYDGKLYLIYTGNVKLEDGTRETYQCLAVSEDGLSFEKKGPVLGLPEGYTAHFRDPKVWREGDTWYMVLGAQTLEEKGAAVLFTSPDLYKWKEAGRIAGADMNGLGEFGYMWECPDLFPLGGKDILMVSPQGLEPSGHLYQNLFQSGYFVGELDRNSPRFTHGPFIEIDRGFDFYAPQTFLDGGGRRIMIAWMGITDEAEAFQPTLKKGWVHALTIPRILEYRDDKVYQNPAPELEAMRGDREEFSGVKASHIEGVRGITAELLLNDFKGEAASFTINLRGEASFSYDAEKKEVSLERRCLRTGRTETRTCAVSGLSSVQLLMDTSSLEIFINGGEEVFTARYFPEPENDLITFEGDAEFTLTKWNLSK
ncbi:glycoside hydrolase family 32 protein [Peribacillus sp. SCS-26]|uniref:glycoside hydrolase family 32 protein n=1 Tax=Paraperibacillus marinus TaxID=3115295 RepID=UPI0039067D1E